MIGTLLEREAALAGINPHDWRKFKQAETNMLRLFTMRRKRRKHLHLRGRKLAREIKRTLDKIMEAPLKQRPQ